jgi:hypothetical protein
MNPHPSFLGYVSGRSGHPFSQGRSDDVFDVVPVARA